MTEAELGHQVPLAAPGRPTSRKPPPSEAHVLCVCLFIVASILLTATPAFLQRLRIYHCHPVPVLATPLPPIPAPPRMPERLQLPWQPVLSAEELRRGETYYGSGTRLNRVVNKLIAGEPIKVYTLGGSVTGGGGANPPERSFVELFFKFINMTFPHRDHVLVNKAIAASTAFLYATCLQHHVPEDVDLVTLEFSVNERSEAPFTSPERRSFEQLVRRLLEYPSRPAVMILHWYAWWEASGDGVDQGLFYNEPEGQLTTLAHYYDVPTVSIRAAAYHLMAAGINRFRVDKVFVPGRAHKFVYGNGTVVHGTIPITSPGAPLSAFFLVDGMHPGNYGHQALAELLVQPLIRAVWEAEAGRALQEADHRDEPRLSGLPPPMIPGNTDSTPGFCAMMEDFKGVVRASSGFEYVPERPNAEDFMHQKWGWRGTEPGSWVELELDTRADNNSGADTIVWLAHLRSYEGMGTAVIECVSGCTCNPTLLDGTWERRASLFWMTRFFASRHKRCRVRVTITEDPGQFPEEGHKVMLVAVMVAHLDLGKAGTLANVEELQNMRRKRKKKR